VALGLSLFAKEALFFLTDPAFYDAYRVVPWIVGGLLFSALYYIPVNFLFLRERTRLIPLVTGLSGVVNIGLNLWLIPRYGVMAAAWTTFLAYGFMLILIWKISLQVYSFPYEYRRLGLIIFVGVSLFLFGTNVQFEGVIAEMLIKGGLLLAYPFLLALLGFFKPTEKGKVLIFTQQVLAGLRRSVDWV
jgi:O-antigen/teichoic acid export membrane protein